MADSIDYPSSFIDNLIGRLVYALNGEPDRLDGSIMLEESEEPADMVEESFLQPDDAMPFKAIGKGLLGLALMSSIKPIAKTGGKAYLPKFVKEAQKRIVPAITKTPGTEAVVVDISPGAKILSETLTDDAPPIS